MHDTIIQLDKKISLYFQTIKRPKWLDIFFVALTTLWDMAFVWFLIAAYFYFILQSKVTGLALFLGVFLVLIIGEWILKHIFRRSRPYIKYDVEIDPWIKWPSSYSFPSGHSGVAWSCIMITILSYMKWWHHFLGIIAIAVVLGVGISFSRIYLRVHFLSDVIIWSLLGSIIGVSSVYIIDMLTR